MEHEFTDESEGECDCDAAVVGGPHEHSPLKFVVHMVYARNPNKCYCGIVCLAHLGYSFGFMALEMGADEWYDMVSATIEPTTPASA